MLVLGLSGGFGLPGEQFIPNLPVWFFHDSAACVVRDGEVLAAVEEERVNRIKHTNMMPLGAISECLKTAGAVLNEFDAIAYFFQEDYADTELNLQYVEHPEVPLRYARDIISERLGKYIGCVVGKEKVHFIKHHQCHATAAFYHSGFKSALISIFDGNGETESISIFSAIDDDIHLLASYPIEKSLGHFYSSAIELLGYSLFDEYKVMGLAPYGDPSVYRAEFRSFFALGENGNYELKFEKIRSHFLRRGFIPRRKGEAFSEAHANFAASLQESLELIANHVLTHWAKETGLPNLCLAGGVAHNSHMNGLLAQKSEFQNVFVHPAAHDAGAALGAALEVCRTESPSSFRRTVLRDVYWGTNINMGSQLEPLLEHWSDFFEFNRIADPSDQAARLIAEGAIIGWAQGRMEFGPRALGNRSILADPRPFENRDRINSAVKKRESYRPFAPAVLAERAHLYFKIPLSVQEVSFMGMTVPVLPDKRKLLGAVTHVDGSARIQTVAEDQNPRFWKLIKVFEQLTGIPVVLNTSFNTAVEPIVRTPGEALLCFLTTDLDFLFLDEWIIKKRRFADEKLLELVPVLDPNVELSETRTVKQTSDRRARWQIVYTYSKGRSMSLSREMYDTLRNADGLKSFRECGSVNQSLKSSEEIKKLLIGRFVGIKGLNINI